LRGALQKFLSLLRNYAARRGNRIEWAKHIIKHDTQFSSAMSIQLPFRSDCLLVRQAGHAMHHHPVSFSINWAAWPAMTHQPGLSAHKKLPFTLHDRFKNLNYNATCYPEYPSIND
jgi:hypothetical protein